MSAMPNMATMIPFPVDELDKRVATVNSMTPRGICPRAAAGRSTGALSVVSDEPARCWLSRARESVCELESFA